MKAVWAERRMFECSSWWYIKLPLGFKRLSEIIAVNYQNHTKSIYMLCVSMQISFTAKNMVYTRDISTSRISLFCGVV
jgi:hypothetical protein